MVKSVFQGKRCSSEEILVRQIPILAVSQPKVSSFFPVDNVFCPLTNHRLSTNVRNLLTSKQMKTAFIEFPNALYYSKRVSEN
jgi:hypothetical protein